MRLVKHHQLVEAVSVRFDGTALALDLGNRTGWALMHNGKITYDYCDLYEKRLGSGARYNSLTQMLATLESHCGGVDAIFYEKVERHLSTYAGQVYGGYKASVEAYCDITCCPLFGVGVQVVKKFLTGSGRASKADMLLAVQGLGFNDVQDDNIADAIGVLMCGLNGYPNNSEEVEKER